MRKDAGTYGDAQRLEQLGWMFFLKIFDDWAAAGFKDTELGVSMKPEVAYGATQVYA